MAFDGIFMHHVCKEFQQAIGARIEKIYQPSKDELVLTLGGKSFNEKLLISISSVGPRVHFTKTSFENPASPPMFCMLMRKKFIGAKLTSVEQAGLDRILQINFSAFNELGDPIVLSIVVEIMGRQSNVILLCNNRIIDALRRSDPSMEGRLILPGAPYEHPAGQNKFDIRGTSDEQLVSEIANKHIELPKAISSTLDGVSPLVARELSFISETDGLSAALDYLHQSVENGLPTLVCLDGKPYDFTYLPINQYGERAECKNAATYSELLDEFYKERQQNENIRRRTHDLVKLVNSAIERTARKIEKQHGELSRCADKEKLRVYGELLKANLYSVEKGSAFVDVPNYYDPEYATIRIPLKADLSPSQNAQRYFKEYRKANTAETVLAGLIKSGEDELEYLKSVLDELSRAESEREISEIRSELTEYGYLRAVRGQKKQPKPLPPHRFVSDDGFDIYVGRNNKQNDELTLHIAAKNDIWLHTKSVHGTHTIIASNGREIPDNTILQAARLAAFHSNARQSSSVAVDYCPVKNVRKPNGAKAGMVIYDNYNTVYVTPDADECDRLSAENK